MEQGVYRIIKLPEINKIQKGKQDIIIECIGDFSEEIELHLLADGKVAGRLGIVPNKKTHYKNNMVLSRYNW